MSTILHIPNPDRQLTDVKIKGWPVILSRGILLGAVPVPPGHKLNVTRKHEIHIAHHSYYDLVIDLYAYQILENSVMQLCQANGINQEEDEILDTQIIDDKPIS